MGAAGKRVRLAGRHPISCKQSDWALSRSFSHEASVLKACPGIPAPIMAEERLASSVRSAAVVEVRRRALGGGPLEIAAWLLALPGRALPRRLRRPVPPGGSPMARWSAAVRVAAVPLRFKPPVFHFLLNGLDGSFVGTLPSTLQGHLL